MADPAAFLLVAITVSVPAIMDRYSPDKYNPRVVLVKSLEGVVLTGTFEVDSTFTATAFHDWRIGREGRIIFPYLPEHKPIAFTITTTFPVLAMIVGINYSAAVACTGLCDSRQRPPTC